MKKKVFCLGLALFLCTALCLNVCAAGYGPVLASPGSGLVRIVLPFVIAGVVCFVLVSRMKTAKKQTEAREYITESGVHITVREDHFTHRTQTRRRVNSDRKKN